MNEQLEIEFKILINQYIYKQILHDYANIASKTYQQTNYYLSHPILDTLQYMLRIREKEKELELTLKRKAVHGNHEMNISINEDIKNKILHQQIVENEIFTILKEVGIDNTELQCSYSLTTTRTDIVLPQGLLSVDFNEYNGHEDYEIELEVTDYTRGKQDFIKLITPYGLQYTQNCPSKIKRVKQTL